MDYRVVKLEVVVSFQEENDIVLTLGPQIKAIKNEIGGRIINVNTPNGAPPELPQIVIHSNDVILQIAKSRIQITIVPPAHINDSFSECADYFKKRINVIDDLIIKDYLNYNWSGIVSTIEFPMKGSDESTSIEPIRKIFSNLVTINWNARDLTTFVLRVGKKIGNKNLNVTLQGYDKRSLEVKDNKDIQGRSIDPQELPVIEVGYQVILDMNSKGKKGGNAVIDLEEMLSLQENYLFKVPQEFKIKKA